MTAEDLAALEAVPANEAVLPVLCGRAVARSVRGARTLDGFELHWHPDREERLGQLAEAAAAAAAVDIDA